ncbi:MAG: hypothetical protein ACLS6P_11585, partial [Clostridium paraputrificum]
GKCFVNIEQDLNGEIAISSLSEYRFQLVTRNKETAEIKLSDVKLQNRAGRGSGVMLVSLDDEIKNVNII